MKLTQHSKQILVKHRFELSTQIAHLNAIYFATVGSVLTFGLSTELGAGKKPV